MSKIVTEKKLDMYTSMIKIRLFEERAMELFHEGLIRGPMHLYIGEEAVAVGACSNLGHDDYITSTHRGHGHCIAKGGDIKKMMAELLGKETGYCKGKGGSMHISDPEMGILGANGIVAGSLGIATGAGLSAAMQKTGQVTLCFFGDGATNQGIFHESLNLASVWKLPVIYICEHNLYGLTSPADQVLSVENVADRAKSYSIYGEIVDGNDVLAVYNVVKSAIERLRQGKGPILIEAKTYRWGGHFVGDPCVYRCTEEVDRWKEKCPIKIFREKLLTEESITQECLKKIDDRVGEELDEAVEYAKKSPDPRVESIYEGLFV